jgi:hypothetical protein
METMPKEVRAWMGRTTVKMLAENDGLRHSFHIRNNPEQYNEHGVPVRILPYPPDDSPPTWERGQKVRHKTHHALRYVVGAGDIHRCNKGMWMFYDSDGIGRCCSFFEPVPTTESVTLRVTGSPEAIADIWTHGPDEFSRDGLTVEVVGDG